MFNLDAFTNGNKEKQNLIDHIFEIIDIEIIILPMTIVPL